MPVWKAVTPGAETSPLVYDLSLSLSRRFFPSPVDKGLSDLTAEGLQSQLPVNELGIPSPHQGRAGTFPQATGREDHDAPGWSLGRKHTPSMALKHTVKISHPKMDLRACLFLSWKSKPVEKEHSFRLSKHPQGRQKLAFR